MKFQLKNGLLSLVLFGMLLVLVFPSNLYALGMGAAQAQSAIGQNMRVRVELFNVSNPNELQIEFSELDGQTSLIKRLTAELDRSSSPLTVVIRSESPVNEPFFSFGLSVTDGTATVTRDFNVLFDLPSPDTNNYQVQELDIVPSRSLNSAGDNQGSFTNSSDSISSEIMGPYDWAKAGQIPAKFGPVLDGQSLWRVARRINEAMGVSIEEMMWALYQANPQAFSSNSVESLQAGQVLTIPSESQVRAIGFSEAKARIQESSNAQLVDKSPTVVQNLDDVVAKAPNSPIDEFSASQVPSDPVFDLTGIDGSVGGGGGESSSAIIQSLAETVGSLSQELINKDEQISLLEGQVEELTKFIRDESNQAPIAIVDETIAQNTGVEDVGIEDIDSILDTDALLADEVTDQVNDIDQEPLIDEEIVDDSIVQESAVDEPLDELIDEPIAQETAAVEEAPVPVTQVAKSEKEQKFWFWIAGALALAAVILFFLRDRLANLFRSLNFGGRDEELDFDYARGAPQIDKNQPVGSRDYSGIQAVRRNDSNELAEGISYLDLADPEPEPEPEQESDSSVDPDIEAVTVSEDVSDEIDYDDGSYEQNEILTIETEESELDGFDDDEEEGLTFDERFSSLIEEKDYSFARELLDFARYNEINDDRYHCERLRLLKAMDDEEGFYEYYYEIESKIPEFPPKLQTEISQFVVQLAQTG